MPDNPVQPTSALLQYLPAIYRDDPFLGRFLSAFEKVLLGREDNVDYPHSGLDATISRLADYIDPEHAPEAFLPWLSTWTAFALRADLNVANQRRFLASILQFYRWRGTKKNLQALLKIFTISMPRITEPQDLAHHFTVVIDLPERDKTVILRQVAIAHALIAMEKPAHASYELKANFPTMQVGVSRVGIDTLLGTGYQEKNNG
jgi:phage tail-like protein